MQNVNFSSVDEFLDYLPEHEREIVDRLRELIHEYIPNANEKLSYNVPYYSRNKRICFIWPASVPWGKVKLNGVQLGFCYGNLLRDELGFLEQGDRKQVFTKTFQSLQDIDVDLVKMFLIEAVEMDNAR